MKLKFGEIVEYYSNPLVRKEIAEYSRGRWVALHTEVGLFLRYWSRTGPPLRISGEHDIDKLMLRFKGLRPRTFYASISMFSRIGGREDVEDPDNILRVTPIWDVDGPLEHWDRIIDVARIIIGELEREGVSESMYLKWSGRGVHVHLHEGAFSDEIISKYYPLDIAYSLVEYIIKRSSKRILEVVKSVDGGGRPLKVENEIDPKRVFTAPLSLHKSLDYAAVCFRAENIDDFAPEWANPGELRHDTGWRKHVEGEADGLAARAVSEIGGYFKRVGGIRTVVGAKKPSRARAGRGARVGRFQVMALLQAARYYLLTGDLEKAKSFGLNRAVFYAWAKYHGRGRMSGRRQPAGRGEAAAVEKRFEYIGDEGALVSERGWFKIGDKEQLPSDYDREVARKIESVVPYSLAWEKAVEYLRNFPKGVLLSQRRFYSEAYRKVRDSFFDKIINS